MKSLTSHLFSGPNPKFAYSSLSVKSSSITFTITVTYFGNMDKFNIQLFLNDAEVGEAEIELSGLDISDSKQIVFDGLQPTRTYAVKPVSFCANRDKKTSASVLITATRKILYKSCQIFKFE